MTKEIIEKYIQFAIENWYKEYDMEWYLFMEVLKWPKHYVSIITSKKFIEAVARWLNKTWLVSPIYIMRYQAKAIYDWTLEDFINNLLPKE